jgi:hypothetical protein
MKATPTEALPARTSEPGEQHSAADPTPAETATQMREARAADLAGIPDWIADLLAPEGITRADIAATLTGLGVDPGSLEPSR